MSYRRFDTTIIIAENIPRELTLEYLKLSVLSKLTVWSPRSAGSGRYGSLGYAKFHPHRELENGMPTLSPSNVGNWAMAGGKVDIIYDGEKHYLHDFESMWMIEIPYEEGGIKVEKNCAFCKSQCKSDEICAFFESIIKEEN